MLKESKVEGVAPGSPEGVRRATGGEPGAASQALVGRAEERSRVAPAPQRAGG